MNLVMWPSVQNVIRLNTPHSLSISPSLFYQFLLAEGVKILLDAYEFITCTFLCYINTFILCNFTPQIN